MTLLEIAQVSAATISILWILWGAGYHDPALDARKQPPVVVPKKHKRAKPKISGQAGGTGAGFAVGDKG